jgi:hypothetical protein
MKYVVFVFLLAAMMGCPLVGETICTMEARPGIVVRVTATESSAIESAMVYAREGSYVDSVRVWDGRASLVHERAGEYVVTVENDGYDTWRQEGVRVKQGECHVQTVELEAALVR